MVTKAELALADRPGFNSNLVCQPLHVLCAHLKPFVSDFLPAESTQISASGVAKLSLKTEPMDVYLPYLRLHTYKQPGWMDDLLTGW